MIDVNETTRAYQAAKKIYDEAYSNDKECAHCDWQSFLWGFMEALDYFIGNEQKWFIDLANTAQVVLPDTFIKDLKKHII